MNRFLHFPGGSPVGLLVMAYAIMGYSGGVTGLSLSEACTKLRTNSPDLELQGITSDGTVLILVLNNQMFTIPQSDAYLDNNKPKLALFDRDDSTGPRIVNQGNVSQVGKWHSDTLSKFTLKSYYYINDTDGLVSVVSILGAKAGESGMRVVIHGQESSYSDPNYAFGFVSDTQQGLTRSFALRPLYTKDEQGNIIQPEKLQIVMTPASAGQPDGANQVPMDKWYRLDFDNKTNLTIRPLSTNEPRIDLGNYQSMVTKIPVFGVIYKSKVHLWNTYSGQVFMYDYQDLSTGGNASVQVSIYPFAQYFACNDDQWKSETESVDPTESSNPTGVILCLIGGLLVALLVAFMAFRWYKGRLSLGKSQGRKSNLAVSTKNVFEIVDGAKSATTEFGSKASKVVASATGAISAQTKAAAVLSTKATGGSSLSSSSNSSASSHAGSTAASTLSKAGSNASSSSASSRAESTAAASTLSKAGSNASSSSASSRGSKAGSSMGSSAGSNMSSA